MTSAPHKPSSEPVAIIGMSCLFPKAPDLNAFWSNILGKVDAVTDPPPESWDPELYYDPNSSQADRIYCKRGGFLGDLARFDPLANNVPPNSVGGEPDQWLALQLARDALHDAGYPEPEAAVRHRTGVILGRGATFNAGTAISVQHSLVITQTLRILQSLHPEYTAEDLEALREGLRSNLPPMEAEIVPGLVPNIVAGRIANRLDLMGPSYTIDAACASSLVAVQNGVRDLSTGACDLVLAGGVQIWTPMPMLSVFCRLNALSRREQIRPFDKDADGTVLGEGLGMLVLKRLEDARRDGDRIYAVITGVAVSSDGRGLGVMAPRLEGEELAIRRAYEAAGIDPSSIGLIEAHGTGTSLGDLTEIQALSRVFGPRQGRLPSVALGTVKSMISHTVPAAGVAGIIKAALALYFKTLPPTLHCDEPNPAFELERTPFYISTDTRPWIHAGPEPRRAGVSAFGFGGVDSHLVLEEHATVEGGRAGESVHQPPWDSELLVLAAESRDALAVRVTELADYITSIGEPAPHSLEDLAHDLIVRLGTTPGPQRLTIVANSFEDLLAKLVRARERLNDPDCKRIQDRSGIYFYSEPLAGHGKVAFLFPGEGSQYPGMLADLCLQFPEVRECFDSIDSVYRQGGRSYVPSDFVFPRPTFSATEKDWVGSQIWDMDVAPAAVLTADEALLRLMEGLGLAADVAVGHSSGEWAALRAAGVFGHSHEERQRWIAAELLDVYRESIDHDDLPRAVLLALGAGREQVEEILAETGEGSALAMDNCPHQVVVAATPAAAFGVAEAARSRGMVVETLEFDRPYHTPGFAPYADRLLAALHPLRLGTPTIPVVSCATTESFPPDAESIKHLASHQWVMPVRFRETVDNLYRNSGVRFFVEVGPRGNLAAFAEDILRGRQACVVAANLPRRSGTTQLNHLAGILTAQGMNLNLGFLHRWRAARAIDPNSPEAGRTPRGSLLKTQFPAMEVPEELASMLRSRQSPQALLPESIVPELPSAGVRPVAQSGAAAPGDAHSFLNTMEQFLDMQERVMTAYLTASARLPPVSEKPASAVPAVPNGQTPAVSEKKTSPRPLPAPPPTPSVVTSGPDLETLLREIVSDRTGYPMEAVALSADLEADLGIDSIKRVEIMGTFRQKLEGRMDLEIDQLTAQRTLAGVIAVAEGTA